MYDEPPEARKDLTLGDRMTCAEIQKRRHLRRSDPVKKSLFCQPTECTSLRNNRMAETIESVRPATKLTQSLFLVLLVRHHLLLGRPLLPCAFHGLWYCVCFEIGCLWGRGGYGGRWGGLGSYWRRRWLLGQWGFGGWGRCCRCGLGRGLLGRFRLQSEL